MTSEVECGVCGETLLTGKEHEWVSVTEFGRSDGPDSIHTVARFHVECLDDARRDGWSA